MLASYLWIKELLPGLALDAEKTADRLTLSGTEVESAEPVGDDHVLDIGVTSNRVDCLCHLGLARELAALEGTPLAWPNCEAEEGGAPTSEAISVRLEDERCGRYVARVIEGVKVGPSPDWLVQRLEAIGLRSVNNVVDVTNYVMFELNQPLHAFDLDLVAGPEIRVRAAGKGEKIAVINGRELELTEEDLVIADAKRPVALAGVMGGGESEVGDGTTRILLESAWFEPSAVRRAARRHALSSDSSHRFERRVDRSGVARASARAARLIMELCGGTLRSGVIDEGAEGTAPGAITLRARVIERVCGITIPGDTVASILRALECEVGEVADGEWVVTPPRFRADLVREIDLVEEVIRVHGFDHVPEDGGMGVRVVENHPERILREALSDHLAGMGVFETVTPDFVAAEDAAPAFFVSGEPLEVRNPVRSGEGYLRRSLLGSLLIVRKHNQDRGAVDVRLFETSRLVAAPSDRDSVPEPHPVLALLLDDEPRAARGLVERLLQPLGITPGVRMQDAAGLAGGSAADLMAGEVRIGVFGKVAPGLLKRHALKADPIFVELDLAAVRAASKSDREHVALARFPAVERDLAVVLDAGVAYARVEEVVSGLGVDLLEDFSLFDLFRGKGVGEGKQSLGLRFRFRAMDRTLESAEVDERMARVQGALVEDLGGEVRGS